MNEMHTTVVGEVRGSPNTRDDELVKREPNSVPFFCSGSCEMKNVVYIVLSLVLLTGFSGEKVVTYLQDRGGVMYEPNTEVPFTGVLVKKYDNGQNKKEEHYKDGKEDELCTSWFEHGQKSWKKTTRMGNKMDVGLGGTKTETSPEIEPTRMVC
jgi:antitoxin component YwqK of YwqJK toxin-antitoxin module